MEQTGNSAARITIAEAARRLDCTPMFLRVAIQRGVFDFGECVKLSGERWTYYVNRAKLEKYLSGN